MKIFMKDFKLDLHCVAGEEGKDKRENEVSSRTCAWMQQGRWLPDFKPEEFTMLC